MSPLPLSHMTPEAILHFWFDELTPAQQFPKDAQLDAAMGQRFGALLEAGARGELSGWRVNAAGRLAEIVLLDQFSRNIYRDTPQAFAQDGMALVLAQELVTQGLDRQLPSAQRAFAYMPYMHSESRVVQAQSARLFAQPGLEVNLPFALQHQAIIERFGRYPHRNAILGRASSDEELTFLRQPGSAF